MCCKELLAYERLEQEAGREHLILKEGPMFLILAVVLLVLYFGGIFAFHITAWFIHLLIVFAIISFILHFVMGRRA